MASIDFRSWRIESDSEGWALGKPKTRLNKKKEREIFLDHPTYHSTLDQALAYLCQRELRESDAKSAAEITKLLREIKQELAAAFIWGGAAK